MDDEVTQLPMVVEDTLAPTSILVARVETPLFYPDVASEIKDIMKAHGGDLEELRQGNRLIGHVIVFPAGTIKTEIWPRLHTVKYQIDLPDGLVLTERESIQGKYVVIFPLHLFSEAIQKKYSK